MLVSASLVFLMLASAPALADPKLPAAAVSECSRLLGADSVRYVLRQIDLTEKQAAQAEGLIETTFAKEDVNPPVDLDLVRDLWRRLDRNRRLGRTEQVEELTQQLLKMGQDLTGHAEFYSNLEPLLTDEQKQKLAWARARLEREPTGAVRPGDLIRIARDLDLTERQKQKLIDISAATNKKLGVIIHMPSPKLKLEMTNFCADEIRAMLTPAQLARFELRVRRLRPDLIDRGLRVAMPADSPEKPSVEDPVEREKD